MVKSVHHVGWLMFTINQHSAYFGLGQLEAYVFGRRRERGTETMKKMAALLRMIGGASLLALVVGCATTMQTEDLLSAAGFNIVPATTPELQARLKAIPAYKVTMVQRDGNSNSHFEVLAGIGRHCDLQSLEHEVEQMVPALKQEVARQGLQVLKKGLPGRQGLPHQVVLVIHPPQHRMEQKR